MMMTLAQRNGVTLPYASAEAIRAAYRFSSLQEFLDLYYTGMSVLRTRGDFFDLAFAYLEKVAAQNVTHVEIFFDPQGHTERGVAFDTVLSGLTDALDKARRDFGITSRLIMCFLRHLPEEQAFDTLHHACRCKEHISAVGLDSAEQGHPPSKFARVYAAARKEGFLPVAHAGDEGPVELAKLEALYDALRRADSRLRRTLADLGLHTSPDTLLRVVRALPLPAEVVPRVLGVDDAHLLDDASAALVYHLVVTGVAFVVATLRTGEPAPEPVTALWKDGAAERLEVRALARTEVGELIEAALDAPVDGLTREQLWQLCRAMMVSVPRVNDKRIDPNTGERWRFDR